MSNIARDVDPEFLQAQATALFAALDRLKAEGDNYTNFCRRNDLNDELISALREVYRADDERMRREVSETILVSIANVTRATGVRFMSLSHKDFMTFENYRAGGWSVAWRIIEDLDCAGGRTRRGDGICGGCGNSSQKQVQLPGGMPLREHQGIYDLREGKLERVAEKPLCLHTRSRAVMERRYRDGDCLQGYLAAAGVTL